MNLVIWRDEYSVGSQAIDQDHKTIFKMINVFYDAFHESRRRSELKQLLNQLVKYAEGHFQREEEIMLQHAYPQTTEHHRNHEQLFATIFALHTRLESDPLPLDHDAIRFLRHWLLDHILQDDKKLGEFLRASKAGA
jgi:hemerythrin